MSFLDNSKNVGTAFWVVGIIQIVLGLVMIIMGVVDENTGLIYGAINGVGGILAGFVYFGFGKDIRAGAISSKWDIFCRFVMVTAITTAINGIFGYSDDIGTWAGNIVIGLIVAIILVFIYKRITDGSTDVLDKIIWIVILVLMVLSFIGSIIMLIGFPIGTIMGICGIIISGFMIIALLDNEVKSKMGM